MGAYENKKEKETFINNEDGEKRIIKSAEKTGSDLVAIAGTMYFLNDAMNKTGLHGGAAFTKVMSMLGGPAGMVGGVAVTLGITALASRLIYWGTDKITDGIMDSAMTTPDINNYLFNNSFTI